VRKWCWFCGKIIHGHAHYPGPAHCGCPLKSLGEKQEIKRADPEKLGVGTALSPWQQLTRLGAKVDVSIGAEDN